VKQCVPRTLYTLTLGWGYPVPPPPPPPTHRVPARPSSTHSSPPSSVRNPMEDLEMSSHTISMVGFRDCIILPHSSETAERNQIRRSMGGGRRRKAQNAATEARIGGRGCGVAVEQEPRSVVS
jgi:hypothetical protein